MRTWWVAEVVLVACGKKDDYKQPPPTGFDAAIDAPPPVDAPPDAPPDAPGPPTGHVCVLTDARQLDSCRLSGVALMHLKVSLGGTTVDVTGDDGAFWLEATGSEWSVTGDAIVSAYMPANGLTSIPAISTTMFTDMKSMSQPIVNISSDRGSIIVNIVKNGSGVMNVTADDPGALYSPLYDGLTDVAWRQGMTGGFGAVWIPGLIVNTYSLTMHRAGVTAPIQLTGLHAHPNGITFATISP